MPTDLISQGNGNGFIFGVKYLAPSRGFPQATDYEAMTVPNISFVEILNQW